MKDNFPEYKQGSLITLEKKLSPTNKKILQDFLDKCSINAGELKVEKIKRIMIQFYDITEKDFDKQTKETITQFLIILNKAKRSKWTKNEIKVYVRKFLKWFYKSLEMIEDFKLDSSREPDPKKINENSFLTKEEVEKMLRCAESYKEKAYLFLSYETGARPQELANLRWKDIKFEEEFADITLFSNKTQKSRVFPVTKTKDYLWEWKQHYSFPDVKQKDFVFPSRWRDKPMTSTGLNVMLRRMAKRSGLDKDVWNYLFRHAKATELYDKLPTQTVEVLMGHKNMSRVYHNMSNKKAREQLLKQIYNIEKLTPQEKDKIKNLEKQNQEIKEEIRKFGVALENLNRGFIEEIS